MSSAGWPGWQVLLFILSAVVALLLAAGYRTRLMSVLTWILLVSLINRNHFVLQAGDQLLVILSFWSMFLPLNVRWSIDAAMDEQNREDPNRAILPPDAAHFSIATIAVILQVLYLYFFTALLKTDASWRSTFDAAYMAVSLEHFATPVGAFLSQFPALLKFGTGYVMAVEFIRATAGAIAGISYTTETACPGTAVLAAYCRSCFHCISVCFH